MVIATRLPLLFGVELDADGVLVLTVPAALLLGGVLGALAERLAWRLTRRVQSRRSRLGIAAGALAAGLAATVAVWALAPVLAEMRPIRKTLERSDVLAQLNTVLEPAGPKRADVLVAIDNLPRYRGRGPDVAAGDPRILRDPDVAAAERSVLKILTTTCMGHGTGTGWVVKRGMVVTNAHVAAGGKVIQVQRRGQPTRYPAVPVWFDGENDIAILRVGTLPNLPALPMVKAPGAGTSGATLGFPRGRWAKRRARIGPTTARLAGVLAGPMPNNVSRIITGRLVTTVRGKMQPGNSGGPVVDEAGHVLTTAFAGGFGSASLGVPNRFVREGLRKARGRVSTGARC